MHTWWMLSVGGVLVASSFVVTGCASNPNRIAYDVPEDRVVSRIDRMGDRPAWLVESAPFMIDGGMVVSLGETEIPGDHRLEAAYRIAQNNAAAGVSGAIEKKLDFIFQNAEEGTGTDMRQVRFIGAEVTRLVTSSLRPGKRYWEKVVHFSDYGMRQTKYRVFATVEIPEPDFRQAIVDSLRRHAGKAGLSAEFAEKVDQQWDRLTAPDHVQAAAPAPVSAPAPSAPVLSVEAQ